MMNRVFWFCIGLMLVLSGCRNLFDQPSWDVDALAPLATSSLSISDLFTDSTVIESRPDRSLQLVLRDTLFSLDADSLFNIPDTTLEEVYPIPGIQIFPGVPYVNVTADTRYKLNSVELRFARVLSGKIRLSFKNTISGKLFFEYRLLSITKGTDTLGISRVLQPGEEVNEEIDLSGYVIDFTGSDDQPDVNSIATRTLAYLTADEDTLTGPFLPLELTSEFIAVKPEYAVGFFGSQTFDFEENAEPISWFQNIPSGQVDVGAGRLNLNITNGTGAEFKVDFNLLTSINSKTGNRVNLTHPVFDGTEEVLINRAGFQDTDPPVVFRSNWDTRFDDDNSNLDALFENLPDFLRYRVNLELNPLGNSSQGNDFIYYRSGIDIYVDAEFPLQLAAEDLVLIDTADLNLGERSDELDDVNGGFLHLDVSNFYPLEAGIQLFILDEQYQTLDSLLLPGSSIAAANREPNGIVNIPAESRISAAVDQSIIDQIYAGKFIQFKVLLNSNPTDEQVKLYDFYRMDIELIADLNYRIN